MSSCPKCGSKITKNRNKVRGCPRHGALPLQPALREELPQTGAERG